MERRGYDNLADAVVDTNRAFSNLPDVRRLGIKFGQVGSTIGNTELTPAQRVKYQEIAGREAIRRLQVAMQTPEYQHTDDSGREVHIRKVMDAAREWARGVIWQEIKSSAAPTPTGTTPSTKFKRMVLTGTAATPSAGIPAATPTPKYKKMVLTEVP